MALPRPPRRLLGRARPPSPLLPGPGRARGAWILLVVACAAAWGALTWVAVAKDAAFHWNWGLDLAFYSGLIASAAEGHGFVHTVLMQEPVGLLRLSHRYFLLPLYVPFFALRPEVGTLFALQVATVVAGAVPVFAVASRRTGSPGLALALAVAWLLSFPVWVVALADFRPLVAAVPALGLAVAAALLGRLPWVALLALLACAVREELVWSVAAAGLVLPFAAGEGPLRRRLAASGALLAVTLAWQVGQRVLGLGVDNHFDIAGAASEWGTGRGALPGLASLAGRVAEPEAGALALLVAPGMLTALLAPEVLAIAAPVLGFLVFATDHEWADPRGPYTHYLAPVLPVIGVAAAVGAGRLLRWIAPGRGPRPRRAAAIGGMAVALVASQAAVSWRAGRAYLEEVSSPPPGWDVPRVAAVAALVERIPRGASAAADFSTIGALAGRARVFSIESFGEGAGQRQPWHGPWFPPGPEDVDRLLVPEDAPLFEHLAADGAFRLEGRGGGYALFARVGGAGEPGAP